MLNLNNTCESIYGQRARIGLILPSLNVTAEPEFNRMKPPYVSVHSTRIPFRAGTVEELDQMNTKVDEASELLATAHVNMICYACTTGSLVGGLGWDKEIIRRIESRTGIPATTTSTAVIDVCRELGINRVVVATPYTEALNQLEKEFFESSGLRVLRIRGLGITDGETLHREPEQTTHSLASSVDVPEAEGVFISCTDFKSIGIISRLELELKKPVFSSNTATLWSTMKKLNLGRTSGEFGSLLSRL